MKRFTILYILLFALLAGGCASDRRISPMMDGMTHISQALQLFGPPDQYLELPDGKITYIWLLRERYYTPPAVYPAIYPSLYGGYYGYYGRSYRGHGGGRYHGGYGGGYYRRPYYNSGYYRSGFYGPAFGLSVGTTVVPGSVSVDYCTLKILTNADGSIITYSMDGNACDKLLLNPDMPMPAPNPNLLPVIHPKEDAPAEPAAPKKGTVKKPKKLPAQPKAAEQPKALPAQPKAAE